MEFIDLKSQQALIRADIEARIQKVLDHGRYVMGPELIEMEEALARYVGVKHCIGVASGTDSLLIALMALGVQAGDEVITVPYTWISTAEMIALIGAKPVFVDIDEKTWNMNPDLLEAAITSKTKAIMPVGIYGQTPDLTKINAIAQKYNLPVIEDGAQSFGATHHGAKSCSSTLVGSTSFFPSKPLGCYGDGGALFTDDDELADSMRHIRVHGQSAKHHHPILGVNGRMDTIQAAIILSKLTLFDDEIAKRQVVADAYSDAISQSKLVKEGLQLPQLGEGNTSVWAQYTMLSPSRDSLAAKLKDHDIPSVSYYAVPLHLQPVFAYLEHKVGDFPVTERVAKEGISLPMNPYLTEEEVRQVVDCFES